MKHYGIQHKASKRWLVDANGNVFWTTSMAVAEAQMEHLERLAPPHLEPVDWGIAEFVPASWRKQVEQWAAENRCPRCGAGPMPITGFDEVLGGCAVEDCPIDPETGRMQACVTCPQCPAKDHCTRQRWCADTGHPVTPVSSTPSKG